MPTEIPSASTYAEALFPFAAAAAKRVQDNGGRFVYYTTADTANRVLRNRQIWMRNTRVMNDFMEVDHGLDCLKDAYASETGRALKKVLEKYHTGITKEFEDLFNLWIPAIRNGTFVTCLSEHSSAEDAFGRLSMWRAYGGSAGVALVFNGGVLLRPSDALAAYSSPVAYHDASAVRQELAKITARLSEKPEILEHLGREGAKHALFHMFRFATVCTKHPAFKEEQEWRVVAMPALTTSPLVMAEIETIGGVPQQVLKIPLKDVPEQGLIGLEPASLIDKLLIGPCEHADVIFQAMYQAMEAAGIPDPGNRIVVTDIPLRPNQR
jgi:hypothetical protein